MKLAVIAISAAALIVSAPAVFAQGVSSKTPGQEMHAKGSKKGSPGASGYAPGQTSGSNTGGMSGPSSTTTKSK